jgi:hypothetical protein
VRGEWKMMVCPLLQAIKGMRKQFQLSPAHLHFGHVETGQLKVKTCVLTNISPDLGRFFIKPVNGPLSLKYKSGALPAGMAVRIEVRVPSICSQPKMRCFGPLASRLTDTSNGPAVVR